MSLFYGVASVSRIDKMISLFCKRALQKRRYSAKETYNLIDPTDRSHSIMSAKGNSELREASHDELLHKPWRKEIRISWISSLWLLISHDELIYWFFFFFAASQVMTQGNSNFEYQLIMTYPASHDELMYKSEFLSPHFPFPHFLGSPLFLPCFFFFQYSRPHSRSWH